MGVFERLGDHGRKDALAIKARRAERAVAVALDFLRGVIGASSKGDGVPVIRPSPEVLDLMAKLGVLLENLGHFGKERGQPLVSGAFLEELQDGLDSIAHRQPPSQSPSVAMELLRFAWEHQDSTLIKFAISILEAQTGVKCEKVPPGEHVL